MLNDPKTRTCAVLAAMALLTLALLGWYFSGKTHEATADVADVRDINDAINAARPAHAGRRPTPLASIPWKRDPDALLPAVVDCARLPWLRTCDQPQPIALTCAGLPWDAQRATSYAPVFLPTSELPWRF